jgi:hypothetical protein
LLGSVVTSIGIPKLGGRRSSERRALGIVFAAAEHE